MENSIKTYLIKIDTVCKKCGMRNKVNIKLLEEINIIACGYCGNFILVPDNFSFRDRKKVKKLLKKSLGDKNVFL